MPPLICEVRRVVIQRSEGPAFDSHGLVRPWIVERKVVERRRRDIVSRVSTTSVRRWDKEAPFGIDAGPLDL